MADTVFVFKVALQGDKKVWRRIAALASQTLDHLHEAIYEAFDRDDPHLYSFYFPPPGARGRAAIRDADEFTSPFNCDKESRSMAQWMGMDAPRNAARTRIAKLPLAPGQKFHYLFDFGDEWWHDITVEHVDGVPDKGKYPRIVEKQGDSPPQYPDYDEEEDGEEEAEDEQ